MADNTTLNTGAGGDVIATDDIGGVKYQIVKVSYGPLDTATAVTTSVGLPTDPLDRAARDCGKIDIAMGQGAHDAAGAAFDPVGVSGWASAAAPADVTADGDIVKAWCLRNGAQATVVTAAGALIGGDAANGLDVDVTRVTGTVTISGTVTANAGTNLNTSSLALDATLTNQQITDNAAFTDGTTKLAMAGFILDDTAGVALTENDAAAARISANRAVVCAIEDGATRARYATVTAANAVKVDGSAVTQPVSGTVSITSNSAVNVAQVNGVTTQTGLGTAGTGTIRVATASDSTLGLVPVTSGGCVISHLISAATTNATSVKASAGQLYGWSIFNTNAAIRYVKLHNTAGAPTAGTGVVYTIAVPATGGTNIALPYGIAFSTGIAFTTVTGTADADTAAVGANDLVIDLHYK